VSTGAATCRAQGHPGGDAAEGDCTGRPRSRHDARSPWPTLLVEAGETESLARLRNYMIWWFSASDHDVKIVLLAKLDHTRRTITLEKWEEEPGSTRPGATTTRAAAALHPVLRQSITITQDTTTDPTSYHVTSELVLGFSLLFLRDPGPGEGDVVLSIQDLEWYAECVWKAL
jgi:hypothetical protein